MGFFILVTCGIAPGARARTHRALVASFTPRAEQTFLEQSTTYEFFPTNGALQCVPFARFLSGISIHGDAWTWWRKAAGVYARGNSPEAGAVLSFPAVGRMPLGHVAVVTQVLDERTILIDHANWPTASMRHGAISRDITVTDVSAMNNWSKVRVQFGHGGPLGSVYPANGFIYDWNEAGVRIARPKFPINDGEGLNWDWFDSV
jgi:hypothetical protein